MPPTHAKKPASMRSMCAHGGPLNCDMGCYAEGGEVMRKDGKGEREVAGESGHSRGVHWQNRGVGSEAGTSHAGMHVKTNSRFPSEIRDEHKSVLQELKSMKGPQSGRSGFAEGGNVFDSSHREDNEKGVNRQLYSDKGGSGMRGGVSLSRVKEDPKKEHRKVLGELKSMKGPHGNYAEGGEVEHEEMEEPKDDGMSDMLVDELMDAFEKKDKQGVKDAIEALVMECMNKGGHDE